MVYCLNVCPLTFGVIGTNPGWSNLAERNNASSFSFPQLSGFFVVFFARSAWEISPTLYSANDGEAMLHKFFQFGVYNIFIDNGYLLLMGCLRAFNVHGPFFRMPTGPPHKRPTQAASLVVCSKYKEMYRKILKSLTTVKLYRGMFKLKVEINVNLPQLLSNSTFRATETTRHNNWGRFKYISTFNLDSPRYNFTIVGLFNIFPYVSLYFEQTRLAASVGSLWYAAKIWKDRVDKILRSTF